MNGNSISDKIDQLIARKEGCMSEKACTSCGAASSLRNRTCTSCSGALIKDKFSIKKTEVHTKTDPYICFNIPVKPIYDIKVLVGEPDMLSPSGFEIIVIILQNIGVQAGVKKYVKVGKQEYCYF